MNENAQYTYGKGFCEKRISEKTHWLVWFIEGIIWLGRYEDIDYQLCYTRRSFQGEKPTHLPALIPIENLQ